MVLFLTIKCSKKDGFFPREVETNHYSVQVQALMPYETANNNKVLCIMIQINVIQVLQHVLDQLHVSPYRQSND